MALGRSHPRLFLALSRIASKTNGPQNFILTHTCLLKNTYEQNLAHCIGAPQRADFFSLILGQMLRYVGGGSFIVHVLGNIQSHSIRIATYVLEVNIPQLTTSDP